MNEQQQPNTDQRPPEPPPDLPPTPDEQEPEAEAAEAADAAKVKLLDELETAFAADPPDIERVLELLPEGASDGGDANLSRIRESLANADPEGDLTALFASCRKYAAGPEDEIEVRRTWDTTKPPPPRVWLSPGWIPNGEVTTLVAPGETGKSLFALQLAVGVATDAPGEYFAPFATGLESTDRNAPRIHRPNGPGTAVFAGWEDDLVEVHRRICWMGADGAKLGDRLQAWDMKQGNLWGADVGEHVSTGGKQLDRGAEFRDMLGDIEGLRLVVIDPLAAAFGSNENDRAIVRQFLNWCKEVARKLDCSVLLLAHPPKPKSGQQADMYSGSTDWRNGVRSMMQFALTKTDIDNPNDKDAEGNMRKYKAWRLVRGKGNYAKKGGCWMVREVVHAKDKNGRDTHLTKLRWARADDELEAGKAWWASVKGVDWEKPPR